MAELFDPNKNYNQVGTQTQQTPSYAQNLSTAPANSYDMAPEAQAQPWDPRGQMQPQTPIHHMPPAPIFGLPPNVSGNVQEEAAVEKKTSRFKLKRKKSTKGAPTILEDADNVFDVSANDAPQPQKSKKSSALVFMMGLAAGMAIMFAGNMIMTNVMQDTSSNEFREIERRAMQMSKPDLPTSDAKALSDVKAP